MKVSYFGVHPEEFDYSEYEHKLRQITSVKLDQINDLQSHDQQNIENSFLQLAQSYFKQIEIVLKNIHEEV